VVWDWKGGSSDGGSKFPRWNSNLKRSNSSIKVGFSSPLLGKTSESTLIQTVLILGWAMYDLDAQSVKALRKCRLFYQILELFLIYEKLYITIQNSTYTFSRAS
jgi:hypothetical protein